ncbi:MAG: glycosyltransferase family 2 protein [Acidobacteria bacterium]|nr:glycosyltransferase family 2 protein [Acidobacteriota bacterium]
MQYVDLIVPTRGRHAKLAKMLESVPREAAGKQINVIAAFDADERLAHDRINQVFVIVGKRIGSVAIRNRVTALALDAVLMATDDVIFEAGAIEAAVLAMEERFPDGDGVVGFVQTNHKSYSPTGVCLVGQNFLRRYPGKQLYFPGYFHFACQEIERLARSLDKLHVEPKAQLFHAHPSTGDGKMDRTHREARVHKAQDQALSKTRREAGLTWGAA